MMSIKNRDLNEVILEFEVEILNLKAIIETAQKDIKIKQQFLRNVNKRMSLKNSELYRAIENKSDDYWVIIEANTPTRTYSYFEIRINKKVFVNMNQTKIIQEHYMQVLKRTIHDIRIIQF
jgi:hypothetical protein